MTLEDLGYHADLESYRKDQHLDSFGVGRIILEHKDRYVVKTSEGEYEAEIIGNLRYSAKERADFPAVGDWVAISDCGHNKVLIHSIFPRKTLIEREAVGTQGEKQIIATNIDYAFIVQAVDRDFNINRIERYLTICNASGVRPLIVLNKIDLLDDPALTGLISKVQARIKHVPILAISNKSLKGIEELKKQVFRGFTYCLLGSSGVGKSSLLNTLSGKQLMKTEPLSENTSKGKHVTSHRELQVLENGGILIDNPGMREVGIADSAHGLAKTFEAIVRLSQQCKYRDCSHTSEVDCAVLAAVESGEIEPGFYQNYLKMEREKAHFESTVADKRKKDKDFGKLIKHYKKVKKH